MPGYVMHLAEGKRIINMLEKKAALSDSWKEQFLTGTLLPDTRLRGEKKYSHFWDEKKLDQLALGPDLDLFLGKYGHLLSEPVILGYLAHLHLDLCYVEHFWPSIIEFYDSQGHVETDRRKITSVYIRHLDQYVPLSAFFSPENYYGDYTKMNGYYVHTYKLSAPDWNQVTDFAMTEVKLSEMSRVCQELTHLCLCCQEGDEDRLKVFELDKLEAFVGDTAIEFINRFC